MGGKSYFKRAWNKTPLLAYGWNVPGAALGAMYIGIAQDSSLGVATYSLAAVAGALVSSILHYLWNLYLAPVDEAHEDIERLVNHLDQTREERDGLLEEVATLKDSRPKLEIDPLVSGVHVLLRVENYGEKCLLRARMRWIGGARVSPALIYTARQAVWVRGGKPEVELWSGEDNMILLGGFGGKVFGDIEELIKMKPEERDVRERITLIAYHNEKEDYFMPSTEWRQRHKDKPPEVDVEVIIATTPRMPDGPIKKAYRLTINSIKELSCSQASP